MFGFGSGGPLSLCLGDKTTSHSAPVSVAERGLVEASDLEQHGGLGWHPASVKSGTAISMHGIIVKKPEHLRRLSQGRPLCPGSLAVTSR